MLIIPDSFLLWLFIAQIILFIIEITTSFLYAKKQKHVIFEYISFTCFGGIATIAVIVLFLVATN